MHELKENNHIKKQLEEGGKENIILQKKIEELDLAIAEVNSESEKQKLDECG